MENNMPDWLLLIRHWISQENTGYALPFLVAARSIKNGNESPTLDDARSLLNEVFNHPFERYIIQLLFCPNLQCLVFGLYQGSIDFVGEENIRGKVFRNKETNTYAVLVRQDILDKYGNTPEQLTHNNQWC